MNENKPSNKKKAIIHKSFDKIYNIDDKKFEFVNDLSIHLNFVNNKFFAKNTAYEKGLFNYYITVFLSFAFCPTF
jgi:hypothetical protein